MSHLFRDFRYGLRMLLKTPGQTVAAVVALGLGIGLTAAMFSIVYGIVLRGLPLPESDRLLHLETQNLSRDQDSLEVGLHDFLDWQKQQTSFTGLAAFEATTFSLSGDASGAASPERIEGGFVTANLFDLLGAKPARGRSFLPGEDQPGAPRVTILSWEIWQGRYGGDPKILGRTVRLNAEPATVVGIMPPKFAFPFNEKAWAPLLVDPTKSKRGEGDTYEVVGRLKAGVTETMARAEIKGISKRLAAQYPDTNAGVDAAVKPLMAEFIPPQVSSLLFLMLAGVFCVLLIACLNVANLMLARASARTRELAIRSALGAGRKQVLVQILVESFLIATLGAALGLGLAALGVAGFNRAIAPVDPPYWLHIELDRLAVLFTLGLALVSGLASGLVPAFQASRADVNEVLKDEGRGSSSLRLGWFSRTIVIAEIAFSCLLLVMAGLMVKSVVQVRGADSGFDTQNLLTFRVPLFEAAYPTQAQRIRTYEQILDRLEGKPGVAAVAASTALPFSGTGLDYYAIEGRAYPKANELPQARLQTISGGYFGVFGARPLDGRDFIRLDRQGSEPVAIVNASFAAKVFPGESAIGRRVRTGRGTEGVWRRIVAVVPDLGMSGFQNEDPRGIYLPLGQSENDQRMSYIVRAPSNPLALTGMARAQVVAVDKDLPIYFVRTMEQVMGESRFFLDLFSTLFAIFGAAALLLASVGIYAVVSFSVGQRTQEIGVRMALGAAPSRVMRLLLGQGGRQLLVGLAFGLPVSFLASKVLTEFLFEVEPSDPSIFSGVAIALALVTLFACLLPAQRALKTDPMVAFRNS
jgi:putative ABC transport system permease protein